MYKVFVSIDSKSYILNLIFKIGIIFFFKVFYLKSPFYHK